MGWNHICDSVKEHAPCGSRRIRNHVQDRSELFPPDDPMAMGADAGLLCICVLYVLTFLINLETSLESGNCPDPLSPTRLPQVCAQCMHRMVGHQHTPFTAAHWHRRSDPSEMHQRLVTSIDAEKGPHTNHVSSTCSAHKEPPPASSLHHDCSLTSRGGKEPNQIIYLETYPSRR